MPWSWGISVTQELRPSLAGSQLPAEPRYETFSGILESQLTVTWPRPDRSLLNKVARPRLEISNNISMAESETGMAGTSMARPPGGRNFQTIRTVSLIPSNPKVEEKFLLKGGILKLQLKNRMALSSYYQLGNVNFEKLESKNSISWRSMLPKTENMAASKTQI